MKRLINLIKNIVLSNYKELLLPYKLIYIVTYKCQFKCKKCKIWERESQDELTIDEIENFFKKSNNFSWINLSGGEIFLRTDIMEIMKIIFKYCKHLYLLDFPTNGYQSFLIEEYARKILEFYPPKFLITVSIDGPEDLHDTIRGKFGSWERAIETFRRLKKIRQRNFGVFFGITLQNDNWDKFFQIFKCLKAKVPDLKIRDLHLNIVHFSDHYYSNSKEKQDYIDNIVPELLYEEIRKITKERNSRFIFNPISYLENQYLFLAEKYILNGKNPLRCRALSASCFIDPQGNVYPCSIYNRNLGNLRNFDYDLNMLLKQEQITTIRNQLRNNNCPQCWTPCEAYQTILANVLPKMTFWK